MIKEPHEVTENPKATNTDPREGLRRFHARIREKSQQRATAPVVISAIGDSVTQGLAGVNEFLHDMTYHHQLKRMLEERYHLCIFNVINGGVEGSSADEATEQIRRDAIERNPDLVLISFGLNDAGIYGINGLDAFGRHLRDHINSIRKHCDASIMLMTSNMMLTRLNDRVPALYTHLQKPFLALQNDGVLEQFAERVIEVALEQRVAVADVYGAWRQRAEQGTDIMDLLANGLNHPNAEGHAIAAKCVMDVIVAAE